MMDFASNQSLVAGVPLETPLAPNFAHLHYIGAGVSTPNYPEDIAGHLQAHDDSKMLQTTSKQQAIQNASSSSGLGKRSREDQESSDGFRKVFMPLCRDPYFTCIFYITYLLVSFLEQTPQRAAKRVARIRVRTGNDNDTLQQNLRFASRDARAHTTDGTFRPPPSKPIFRYLLPRGEILERKLEELRLEKPDLDLGSETQTKILPSAPVPQKLGMVQDDTTNIPVLGLSRTSSSFLSDSENGMLTDAAESVDETPEHSKSSGSNVPLVTPTRKPVENNSDIPRATSQDSPAQSEPELPLFEEEEESEEDGLRQYQSTATSPLQRLSINTSEKNATFKKLQRTSNQSLGPEARRSTNEMREIFLGLARQVSIPRKGKRPEKDSNKNDLATALQSIDSMKSSIDHPLLKVSRLLEALQGFDSILDVEDTEEQALHRLTQSLLEYWKQRFQISLDHTLNEQ